MSTYDFRLNFEWTNAGFLIFRRFKMAKIDFINQLKALGIIPQEPSADKIFFEWTVPVGKNISKKIFVGFIVGDDFPANCPTGPHIKAFASDWIEHPLNISDQNFGHNWTAYPTSKPDGFFLNGWRYWSRPCPQWNESDKTVKFYLAHIKKIMMSV